MASRDVEVIIPTANRPEFLCAALQSVVSQCRDAEISRVVVSENGGNKDSWDVVRRFEGSLSIEYRFRSPVLPPLDHWIAVFEESRADYVAFLCDDDWWYDGHLRRSLDFLERHSGCASSFAASFFTPSEAAVTGQFYFPTGLRRSRQGFQPFEPSVMTTQQVHSAAWLVTPFHSSTMVARTGALQRAASRLRGLDFFNIDRLLEINLSQEGALLFFPQLGAGVRLHAENWTLLEKRERLLESDRNAVRLIEASALAGGFDLAEFWKLRILSLPMNERKELIGAMVRIRGWSAVERTGITDSAFGGRLNASRMRAQIVVLGPLLHRMRSVIRRGLNRLA
jgi:hypothetical protein